GSNVAYVKLGGSSVAATSGDDAIPAGGAVSFQVWTNTYIAGIETAGGTTLNISGGSGLPTGWGGGSGGGGGGGGGTSGTDEATFTAGTSMFTPNGGFFQTTATSNPLTNGQWGIWQMTAYRAGMVDWFNHSGTEMGTSASPVIVSGPGTAGSAAAGVVTVQGVASMTPVQVSQATASNLNA